MVFEHAMAEFEETVRWVSLRADALEYYYLLGHNPGGSAPSACWFNFTP